MEILLERDIRSTKSTTGKLFVNGLFECFVLEDEDRGLKSTMPIEEINERKIYGNTCIPTGSYRVVVTMSNRFKRMLPLLQNVKGYEGIRIHTGNTDANTEGCILPGAARQSNMVTGSRIAFDKLFTKITQAINNGERVVITII
jgi:hypothetical protein